MEYPPTKQVHWKKRYSAFRMDLARGIADLANALTEGRPPRLRWDFCLHVAELTLAIQSATEGPYKMTTTFAPLEPMDDSEMEKYLSVDW